MAVYLQGGSVLLSSGSVATDAGCCCGEGCCLLHFTLWTHSLCEGTPTECASAIGCTEQTCALTGTFSVCDDSATENHYVSSTGVCDVGAGLFIFELTKTYPDPNWYLGINIGCFGSSTGGPFTLGASPLGFFSWDHLHDGSGSDVPYMNYRAMLTIDCGADGVVGACCHADTVCTQTTIDGCAGTWQGEDVPCDPNPCPTTGACCVGDFCLVTDEDSCISGGGTYQGAGTVCEDYVGACCTESVCYGDTCEDFCVAIGGTFVGAGSTCNPGDPC